MNGFVPMSAVPVETRRRCRTRGARVIWVESHLMWVPGVKLRSSSGYVLLNHRDFPPVLGRFNSKRIQKGTCTKMFTGTRGAEALRG